MTIGIRIRLRMSTTRNFWRGAMVLASPRGIGRARGDPLLQFFHVQQDLVFHLVFHLVSPPFCFGMIANKSRHSSSFVLKSLIRDALRACAKESTQCGRIAK